MYARRRVCSTVISLPCIFLPVNMHGHKFGFMVVPSIILHLQYISPEGAGRSRGEERRGEQGRSWRGIRVREGERGRASERERE